MKIKLAKYAARLLSENGITQCFSVTGGGAMHLNDGFGHEPGIHTLYMHHEQACSMAAESYARVYNRPAILCVTTGPGGTNAITGVLGAWLDSIPMIVISGQVRFDNTARWSGTGIRSMGDQEFDILRSVECMTKYSRMITDPRSIRFEIEKCIWLSQTGRPGPCWLDIPVDIQGTFIDDEDLPAFDIEKYLEEAKEEVNALDKKEAKLKEKLSADSLCAEKFTDAEERKALFTDTNSELLGIEYKRQYHKTGIKLLTKDSPEVLSIIEHIKNAKRPVFYTGNGIRIAGAHELFLKVADKLGIPVVVSWNATDIIPTKHPLKAGHPGSRGDRPGNFAVQNADFILSIGSRLNIRQVGYNFKTWAREAFTIVCDIDEEELKKPSVHIDIPVHTDAYILLKALDEKLDELGITGHGQAYCDTEKLLELGDEGGKVLFNGGEGKDGRNWRGQCRYWMKKYNPYQEKFAAHGDDEAVNVYEFFNKISLKLEKGQITSVGNGSPCVAGAQSWNIKDGTKFISQDAVAAMGYDIPGAIGACVATHNVSGAVCENCCADDYASKADANAATNADVNTNTNTNSNSNTVAELKNNADLIQKGKLSDKDLVLKELELARKNPYWKGAFETYPKHYDHDIILPTGDGSIMMNLQELQTIVSHRMPIKIFLINNGGYHSIRQTQKNLFGGEPLVGIGDDSFDLSFPEFKRIATAFGIPYDRIEHNSQIDEVTDRVLKIKGPAICEVIVSRDQPFEPVSAVKKHPDGSLSSPPLEDLKPFLSAEELEENMFIPRVMD